MEDTITIVFLRDNQALRLVRRRGFAVNINDVSYRAKTGPYFMHCGMTRAWRDVNCHRKFEGLHCAETFEGGLARDTEQLCSFAKKSSFGDLNAEPAVDASCGSAGRAKRRVAPRKLIVSPAD